MDGGCAVFLGEMERDFKDEFLRITTGNKMVAVVTFMGATTIISTAIVWLLRRHGKSMQLVTLRLLDNLNETMTMVVHQEIKKDIGSCGGGAGGGLVLFDCIVCLSPVSPGDEYRKLPNCNHGVQFHAKCIKSWLKDHSTCPMCRRHVPRPVLQQLYSHLFNLRDDLLAYCDSALENVASSIGDCREF